MTITPEQRTERLTQLRRVVEAAPDHLLHMRAVREESDCGTAYCAFGWAWIDPWFRQNTMIEDVVNKRDPRYGNGWWMDMGKSADLFGISRAMAGNLFGAELNSFSVGAHAVSKRAVLTNIDRLLRGERARPYSATRR